jgi:nitrite reductase/ring-hydroxylating ferredoxin subunit
MSSQTEDEFVDADLTVEELRSADGQRVLRNVAGRHVAVFSHEDEVYAIDNRCPHMGFPLTDGSVEDGILTCHWHHARFERSCVDTFDPFADDVPTYPVEVRGDDVWVALEPEQDDPPAEHWSRRLADGLQEDLPLVIAKSVIGMDDAGVPPAEDTNGRVRANLHFGGDIETGQLNGLDDTRMRRRNHTGVQKPGRTFSRAGVGR